MTNLIAISDARNNLPSLVNRINETLDRFFITVNGQPKAAILSIEELESIEETAEILAIPGARQSIKKGMADARKGKTISLPDLLARSK